VDIRTKLVFTLVAVAMTAMLVFGVIANRTAERQFRDRTALQLDGLAAFKEDAVAQVVAGWSDRVALVTSRTALRTSLAEFNRTRGRQAAEQIERILADAEAASPLFVGLWVHDASGRVVASAGDGAVLALTGVDEGGTPEDLTSIRFTGVVFRGADSPLVTFSAPLVEEGERVGFLRAVLTTTEIEDLSDNYTGLGETGETIVVARDGSGGFRVLHPLRFAPQGYEGAGFTVRPDHAVARSLSGGEVGFTGGYVDYRGAPVFLATRLIPSTGWGVAVKIDQAEQELPIVEFRRQMRSLALALAAFAILFGTAIGIRVAQPIHHMAETAEKIAAGDLTARTHIQREDEVGMLARTFDGMASALEEQVGLLSEYRKFFDVSIDMMCIAGTDGFFKKVNSAFSRELGWTEEQLTARPFVELVHPDDVASTLQEIEKLAGGTPTIRFANRFLCTDGSYKWLRWNAYPEPETGRLYAIARRTTAPEGAS
jgi:PAS domain S-box-containing protein